MNKPIHLDLVKPAGDVPQRLNLFAGRHLGEREFDLLQAYADDRLAPYLTSVAPGIVAGLEAGIEFGAGAQAVHRLHVRPGNGIGADGRPLRLHYRLELTWPQLLEYAEREQDGPLLDGFYFLHLERSVELADADLDQASCRRAEPDPLRDRRLETVSLVGLRWIGSDAGLLAMPQNRAANRLLVRFLQESPFDSVNGGLPLGLLKVVGRAPVWFDALAGRFDAVADAPYRSLLAHTQNVLEQYSRDLAAAGVLPNPSIPLGQQLGIDFLPAAGPLPAELLRDPGGENPGLAFAAQDLQVDLLPLPASGAAAVVARELPRGVVDLAFGRGDRIRLLLAVADADYRPNLMDQPQPDAALESELLARGNAAIAAWNAWKTQWLTLFAGLDALPASQTQGIAMPPLPLNEAAFLSGLTARASIDQIVAQREKTAGEVLPQPYRGWKTNPRLGVQSVTPITAGANGMHRQRLDLVTSIDALEGELEENFQLMNELNDFLGLQRQHLDAITVSFSGLAGGVPGDGSGMNLIRWSKYAEFQPKIKAD